MRNDPPVYLGSQAEAIKNGEVEQWRSSYWANVACRDTIEAEIAQSFDGWSLDTGCVGRVVEEFGQERVQFVLATTLRELDYDGRFSRANKEWASGIEASADIERAYNFKVTSHPAILDGFISAFRQEYLEPQQAMEGQVM